MDSHPRVRQRNGRPDIAKNPSNRHNRVSLSLSASDFAGNSVFATGGKRERKSYVSRGIPQHCPFHNSRPLDEALMARAMRFWFTLMAAILASTARCPGGAAPSLLEVSVHGQKLLGKLEAKGSNACWLLERDGKLSFLEINEIDSIRTAAPRFREFSLAELRDQLRRTLPKQFRIDGTGHFLICSEKNSHHLGEICEDTYRTFYRYFTVRGFKISPPEFPLVVIVFPDHASFVSYCRKDGIEPPSGLLGYYMRLTNRVALFDRGQDLNADLNPAASHDRLTFAEHGPAVRFDGMVEGNLHDTIVHETTHQCAFNMGLHSRIGPTPKWVIEGLATMFEAPGIRDSQKSASPKSRINRSRYVWFGNYHARASPAAFTGRLRGDRRSLLVGHA